MTNSLKRGEVWLAALNPTQGSEQSGIRPVIIFQNDLVSQFSFSEWHD
jgi:mRNA interferase MazF